MYYILYTCIYRICMYLIYLYTLYMYVLISTYTYIFIIYTHIYINVCVYIKWKRALAFCSGNLLACNWIRIHIFLADPDPGGKSLQLWIRIWNTVDSRDICIIWRYRHSPILAPTCCASGHWDGNNNWPLKGFCLSKDVMNTFFFLGDYSLELGLGIDTTFNPC